MLVFLTTSSIMAMNEANANGVAPGYKSAMVNEKLRSVWQPMKVWCESLDHAWCSPRIPGIFAICQSLFVVTFKAWNWAGLTNYSTLLQDREFWQALTATATNGGFPF